MDFIVQTVHALREEFKGTVPGCYLLHRDVEVTSPLGLTEVDPNHLPFLHTVAETVIVLIRFLNHVITKSKMKHKNNLIKLLYCTFTSLTSCH